MDLQMHAALKIIKTEEKGADGNQYPNNLFIVRGTDCATGKVIAKCEMHQ